MGIIDILLIIFAAIPLLALFFLCYELNRNGQNFIGKPTVFPVFFYLEIIIKALIFICILIAAIKPEFFRLFPWLISEKVFGIQRYSSLLFLLSGDYILLSAYYAMGIFTRIGLPHSIHVLITNRIYHYSRNPMVLSLYLFSIACLMLIPSFFLLPFILFSLIVQHKMILREEKYLLSVLGRDYITYKEKTPRYL